jgi:hypothetical protein
MPPSPERHRNRTAIDELLRAARFLPRLKDGASDLNGFLEQQQAMQSFSEALHSHENKAAVMRQVVLSSVIPKHLCSCLALALQHLSAAPPGSVGAGAPSLAAAASMAHLARLPLPATSYDPECRMKLATVVGDTGEHFRCSSQVA